MRLLSAGAGHPAAVVTRRMQPHAAQATALMMGSLLIRKDTLSDTIRQSLSITSWNRALRALPTRALG